MDKAFGAGGVNSAASRGTDAWQDSATGGDSCWCTSTTNTKTTGSSDGREPTHCDGHVGQQGQREDYVRLTPHDTPGRTASTTKVGSPGWSLFATEGTLHKRLDMLPRGGCHLVVDAAHAHDSLTPCAGSVDAPTVQLLYSHRLCTSCSPEGKTRYVRTDEMRTVAVAVAATANGNGGGNSMLFSMDGGRGRR